MLHLYSKTQMSDQVKKVIEAFDFCESVDISNINIIKDDDIYIVEIDKAQKELLIHIRNLLIYKKNSLIYFFINDSHSLMLFQLASLLNVKSIITNKSDILKTILHIKKDISFFQEQKLNKSIVKALEKEQYFLYYKGDKLKFASQKLYKDFEFENLSEIELEIESIFDLQHNSISTFNKHQYMTINKKLDSDDERMIYIKDIGQNTTSDKLKIEFIKNRIFFIETLKEKILQESLNKPKLGIITIQVENIFNLKKDWSEYDIEIAVRDLLLQIKMSIHSNITFAQYDNGLYLTLFEGFDFEAIKEKALEIQKEVAKYTKDKIIKPIIGLYAFDVNDLELNTILKIISDIAIEKIKAKDIENKKLHRVLNLSENLDDARAIDIFLQTAFINKTPVKLINIYKGICINTSSTIVKKTDQEIYVTYEHLQGVVMQFEGATVIQSSSFTKDILADVKYIDLRKKVAQLKNFRFIKGSANAREYSRVTCSVRTPISIFFNKETLSGEILDISMNAIAIKTRVYDKVDEIKDKIVTLHFTLPVKSAEEEYSRLTLKAKVIVAFCNEDYCKIVVNLEEDQSSEAILMEYVYNRQKEIITELRKQTKLFK